MFIYLYAFCKFSLDWNERLFIAQVSFEKDVDLNDTIVL